MNEELFFDLMLLVYFFASVCYIGMAFLKNREKLSKVIFIWGMSFAVIGWVNHLCFLFLRGSITDHVPWADQFESMVFLAFLMVTFYFFMQWKYKQRTMGALVLPLVFIMLVVANLLPMEYKRPGPVMPALNSYWIKIHVTIMLTSYAVFSFAFCTSLAYLFKMKNPATARTLDELTYRAISIGFPLLTVGIMCGAAWGHVAWGTYWGWDPKETWALITWFIYVMFLHARLVMGWDGKRSAWLSIAGYICVLFTYFGVNFLLAGLHSYAKP